jgi:hypothetical protein
MYDPSYYRQQAERAARLSDRTHDKEAAEVLASMARDFTEIAEDLEKGAVEIRHPELMPQNDSEKKASN